MTATYTTTERLALGFAGLLVAAVLAFGVIHVAPNRHLFPQNEIVGTHGLYWAAILLLAGVWLVARGRRQIREWKSFNSEFDGLFQAAIKAIKLEPIPKTIDEALASGWTPVEVPE
ncbi:hypothetical protein [Bradyrhizobium elkanii]|uniref:Uncharacterized membrane protein YcjF (UPF0283 family) n=1 Tax=Bradyrhizobium elkanii TaxID=29448 RepID=A0A8I1Y6S5_BRAEL|nr:hypothetical protein [Bradyrhizobium elkanii]MBP1294302.1 uncharacterized membrane protein YcjF (UPF0283 family) [Bradyrhizobium elkanii]